MKYREFKKKKKQRERFKRGNMLEAEAKSFLEKKGYFITNEQAIFYHKYEVNGESKSSKLIVDYIAEKNGEKYIVEVKSGKSAISLKDKNSRRQLLEYDFVIENDGVVLLDMESRTLQLVKFQSKAEKKETHIMKVIVIISVVAILIPFWSFKILASLILAAIWFYPDISKNIITKLKKRGFK
ncbi:MAG: hypothetical protein ACQERU_13990 [Bacteroidota bacterium]